MATRSDKTSLNHQRVYHQRFWLLTAVFIAAICLFFPALTVYLAFTFPSSFILNGELTGVAIALGLVSLFLLVLAGAIIYPLWKVRLIIAPEGIMYIGLGFRVYSPWWNVRGIGSRSMGYRRVDGLLVGPPVPGRLSLEEGIKQQVPVLEMSGWLRLEVKLRPVLRVLAPLGGLSPRMVDHALDMRTYASIIPISLFVPHWQRSEAAALIAQYVPHVLVTGKPS